MFAENLQIFTFLRHHLERMGFLLFFRTCFVALISLEPEHGVLSISLSVSYLRKEKKREDTRCFRVMHFGEARSVGSTLPIKLCRFHCTFSSPPAKGNQVFGHEARSCFGLRWTRTFWRHESTLRLHPKKQDQDISHQVYPFLQA